MYEGFLNVMRGRMKMRLLEFFEPMILLLSYFFPSAIINRLHISLEKGNQHT